MHRRALTAKIPPMPTTRIPLADVAEGLAAAMEAALDNGGTDRETVQKWAEEVRELGRLIASQRVDLLRHRVPAGTRLEPRPSRLHSWMRS